MLTKDEVTNISEILQTKKKNPQTEHIISHRQS